MDDWKLEPAHDLGLPLKDRARSLRREDGLLETLLHWSWWVVIGAYLKSWHRLEISGRERIPAQPPFVLVANHASHLDVLVLAAALPARIRHRVFPIAAGDTFFQTPATAAFAAFVLNALPMWRKRCGSHALHELRDRLVNEPCAFILFPEGTRSRDGMLNRFKPGIGMLAAGTTVPIVPCYLSGCYHAWPPGARMPHSQKIQARVGETVSFETTPDDRSGWEFIARELERRVQTLAR